MLHLTARSDAPIACDMSTATDTPDERLREYSRLFDRALLRRSRSADAVEFAFRSAPGVREWVEDLARRESACCPFLDYRVDSAGDEVIWTTSGDERAGVGAILDAFHDPPGHAGGGLLDRLADRGVTAVEAPGDRRGLA